eukprot:CAMPEP_0194049650 /NCGR_PEP_ID=MMETSP0009_2-20130614/30811_1 /TAXON_ID=210454 /ORGANISM="Grammatophora oceanica, Strain CCMP 410" /LENGTH=513 /DNA_ID=CAMNT_0038695855 /DNA_START=54 /DNA_END=1595 /DNA_ORIENTATION=-
MAPDGTRTQMKQRESAGVAAASAAAAMYAQPVGTVVAHMPIYATSNQSSSEDDEGRMYASEGIPAVMNGASVASRRVPCKARGIAEHHNSATAYFDIPLDAPHGMLLLCSHPACHGSGRRFRYCKVCELPVAKRNFVKRHSHDLKPSVMSSTAAPPPAPPPLQITAPGETARLTAVPIRWPEGQRKRRSVSYDAADTLNQMMQQGVDAGDSGAKKARSSVVTTSASGPSILKTSTAPNPVTSSGGLLTMTMAVGSREHQWMQLLQSRPQTDDSVDMPSWMSSVIAVSEGGSHMESITVTPPSPAQQAPAPFPTVTWETTTAAPRAAPALAPAPATIQVTAPAAPMIINPPTAAQANGFVVGNPAPAPTPVSWSGMNVTVTKVAAPPHSMAMPPPPSALNGTTTPPVSSLLAPAPAPTVTMQPAAPAPQTLTVTMQPAARPPSQQAPTVSMAPSPAFLHLAAPANVTSAARQIVVHKTLSQSPAPVQAPSPAMFGGATAPAPAPLPQIKPEVSV